MASLLQLAHPGAASSADASSAHRIAFARIQVVSEVRRSCAHQTAIPLTVSSQLVCMNLNFHMEHLTYEGCLAGRNVLLGSGRDICKGCADATGYEVMDAPAHADSKFRH